MFIKVYVIYYHEGAPNRGPLKVPMIIGWSNNHFNNPHVRVSLETKDNITCLK